jgi:uncharacterized protein YjbI with pentapeptide repeats
VYWQAHGMPWRAEPEADAARQAYLTERRAITPDVEKGQYPFRDEHGGIKLTRADVEWLLATHESGGMRGPVDVRDLKQQQRQGLDLQGADLRRQDLSGLPLARMRGGVTRLDWYNVTSHQREAAAVHLEEATLREVHLEDAHLRGAHLERAYLRDAHLAGAELVLAHLEGAMLFQASLRGEFLSAAAPTSLVHRKASRDLILPPADIHQAFFDGASSLSNAVLGDRQLGGVRVADVRWDGANLGRTTWREIEVLYDEVVAGELLTSSGQAKSAARRLEEHQTMVRAYRQLSIALREQGVNEDADRFAYRAQYLQRQVLRRERAWLRYLGSVLLDAAAGYGYRPLRSVIAYVVIIGLFAGAYLLNGQFATPHLRWDEALVLSISSFHGRGFFTSGINLGDTLARLAAGEAIIGLLIEITFIATFTQRFFAR